MGEDAAKLDWLARARAVLPAGGLGNYDPSMMIASGAGARVTTSDGREYIDLLISSGPMLLGHGHPEVLEAVNEQLARGMTYFANNPSAVELAEEICRAVPCAEQVRYVTTGGEADMYAIRLARAYTGRTKLIKFEGGYHGMSAEAQMSLAPKRAVNFPTAIPDSAGIPKSVETEVLIAPYNDLAAVRSLFLEHGDDIAAVIAEPLQRIIPPQPGFLQGLRNLCDEFSAMLIFDEVVTGFRFAYGGAQELYRVTPDICALGKIIGGGLPLGAVAARKEIMDCFDLSVVGQSRWLMQLGTLAGNPLAAVAGLKTMEILRRDGAYARLEALGVAIQTMISEALTAHGVEHRIVGHPSLFNMLFTDREVRNYRDVVAADAKKAAQFNAVMRAEGVLKSPAKIYACLALNDDDMDVIANAVSKAAAAVAAVAASGDA